MQEALHVASRCIVRLHSVEKAVVKIAGRVRVEFDLCQPGDQFQRRLRMQLLISTQK